MTASGKRTDHGTVHEEKATSEARLRVRPAVEVSDTEVARIVLKTDLSITTVQRWARGLAVFRTTVVRIERAMRILGIVRRERDDVRPRRRIVSARPRPPAAGRAA